MSELWICGKFRPDLHDSAWEFQGVFVSEQLAIKACVSADYFIGPAKLDEALPDETMESWAGAYRPMAS